jgi:glycosyltransferase involved in cell wall biosynthesis/SAM-dependent methyltransferase
MRLAFFSPMPPSKSGIADYSAALLEPLARHVRIGLFDQESVAFDPAQFDLALYQLGNNPYHEFVYEMALRHPGVVVMHEANLHHLVAGLTIRRDDWEAYLREAEYDGGEAALAYARRVRALEVGPDYEGRPMIRRVLECARAIIVHSRCVLDQIRAAGFQGPVELIPHGAWVPTADRWACRQRLGIDETTPLIGSFGFLKPYKRIAESLRAFRRLLRLEPRAKFILAGEPHPDFPVQSLIRTLGLSASVRVLGFLPIDDFVAHIAACDIVLNLRYPTVGESSGSMLRALGLGRPVLVSDVGSFRDFPDDVCLKVPVDRTEEDQIFEFLNLLVSRPEVAREFGRRARQWVERECNWEIVARKYASFLESVAGRAPAADSSTSTSPGPEPPSPEPEPPSPQPEPPSPQPEPPSPEPEPPSPQPEPPSPEPEPPSPEPEPPSPEPEAVSPEPEPPSPEPEPPSTEPEPPSPEPEPPSPEPEPPSPEPEPPSPQPEPPSPEPEAVSPEPEPVGPEREASIPPPSADDILEWVPPKPPLRAYVDAHLSRLARTLEITPPGSPAERILEMGTYMNLAPALRKRLGYGEVRACYYGELGIVEHREVTSSDGERFGCDIELFDAEKDVFPYPAEYFATVLCCELVEHLSVDPMHMMIEVNRILRPGGHLVLTTPNLASLRAISAILQGYNPGMFPQYIRPDAEGKIDPRHSHEYTPFEVRLLLSDGGFEVCLLETGPFYEQPRPELAWVRRLLEHYEYSTDLRDEGIYAVGRKIAPPRSRYPAWLYG